MLTNVVNVIFLYLKIHVPTVEMPYKELKLLNVLVNMDFLIMELQFVNHVNSLVKVVQVEIYVVHVLLNLID